MNNERHHRLSSPQSTLARLLSLLLLGFIVYGTTVEAAHNHGTISLPKSTIGSSNFSSPETDLKAANNLLSCGDCLICQLHQQFSTSVIAVPPSLGPTALTSRSFNLTAVAAHSQIASPRTGRGPPQTIL